jgi:hypothetical protein
VRRPRALPQRQIRCQGRASSPPTTTISGYSCFLPFLASPSAPLWLLAHRLMGPRLAPHYGLVVPNGPARHEKGPSRPCPGRRPGPRAYSAQIPSGHAGPARCPSIVSAQVRWIVRGLLYCTAVRTLIISHNTHARGLVYTVCMHMDCSSYVNACIY